MLGGMNSLPPLCKFHVPHKNLLPLKQLVTPRQYFQDYNAYVPSLI